MKPYFKKLIIDFLGDCSDLLGNKVCNDFSLSLTEIPPEEWEELDRQIHIRNGDPQEHIPGQNYKAYDCQSDFVICWYVQQMLKDELVAETQNQQE